MQFAQPIPRCRKYMEADHPNRPKLDATLVEVQQVAGEVNDRVKAEERQRRIFDVYNLLDGAIPDLVQAQRRFILDIPELTVTFPISKDNEVRRTRFDDAFYVSIRYSHRCAVFDVHVGNEFRGKVKKATAVPADRHAYICSAQSYSHRGRGKDRKCHPRR
jgi:hypothetical protein